MPFDYESFMTGVITGLKLGRVSKGRKPPVPSGRYILTESGERMVREPTVTDATMLDSNTWLPATEFRPDNTVMFHGTRQNLLDLLANLNGQYMITEGG